MKTAIAFLTKDRVGCTKETLPALLSGAMKKQYDLYCFDGSTTKTGEDFIDHAAYPMAEVVHNVRGGADAAIVYALTRLLQSEENYDYIGLCENDVLLPKDWFVPTIALFQRAESEGLQAGAVSARCYEDRILIQRDGYAVCHNLGAGHVIFSREAAEVILRNYRNPWTLENRRTFMQVSGLDIGKWWCFRGGTHFLTVDWGFDRALVQAGLVSLALTPSPVQMVGQDPSLHEQGLKLATDSVELLRNDKAFATLVERTRQIRNDEIWLPAFRNYRADDGSYIIFPHHLGPVQRGDWRLQWTQGFGPFSYRAGVRDNYGEFPYTELDVSGPCSFMVSGGKEGGKVEVEDMESGYKAEPDLPPEGEQRKIMNIQLPAGVSYRTVRLTALNSGIVFYGLITTEPQPWDPNYKFDFNALPQV